MKLSCGCLTKTVACLCAFDPHQPHEIYVSPCADQEHIARVGTLVKPEGSPMVYFAPPKTLSSEGEPLP